MRSRFNRTSDPATRQGGSGHISRFLRRWTRPRRVTLFGGVAAVLIPLADAPRVPFLPELAFPALCLALVLLIVVSMVISARWGDEREWDEQLIDAALLTLALTVIIGLVLGTFGILTVHTLFAATGLVTIVAAIALWPAGGIRLDMPQPESDSLLVWLPRAAPLAVLLFAVVQAVGGRILEPPIGDAIGYHLPAAVHWLQTSDLSMPIPAAGDPSPPFYPLNSTIWTFWALAPFENASLARFMQLPFLLLLALAAYRLARELRLSPTVSLLAGAIAATLPDIARNASIAENDLILAALLVATTAEIARYWRTSSKWAAAMAAVALGLTAGTKVTALAMGGPLGLVLLVLVVVKNRDRYEWVGHGAVVVGIVALLGGYSYLRNTIMTGNPLYPAAYEIGGWRILDGLYLVSREWRETHPFYPFDWEGFFLDSWRDFGLIVTALAVPGLALAFLVVAWQAIRRRLSAVALALLIWTPLSMAIFWFVIPYHFDRFLYATVAWGAVLAIWAVFRVLSPIPQPWRDLVMVVLACPLLAYNAVATPLNTDAPEQLFYWVVAGFIAIVAVGIILLVAFGDRQQLVTQAAGGLFAMLLLLSFVWPAYARIYVDRQGSEWRHLLGGVNHLDEAWKWVDNITADEPATIAVIGTNEIYPLYGDTLKNRVVTIWHSGELARYGWARPFTFYSEPDLLAWSDQLKRQGVDFVYITQNVSFGGWPIEREWLEARPQFFSLAFNNGDVMIWSVGGLN